MIRNSSKNIGEFRYPSAKAFYYGRQIAKSSAPNLTGIDLQQSIDYSIYNFIVDCWIVFQNPKNTVTNSSSQTSATTP